MDLLNEIQKKAIKGIEARREAQIKERLSHIGHVFETQSDFYQFVKDRLTIITTSEKREYFELYIDFDSPNRMLIATWWNTFNIKTENGKMIATSGDPA